MKRTERHHLKENEVALSVARVKETLEIYRKPIIAGLVVVCVVVAAVVGFALWRQSTDSTSRAMLADAMAVEQAAVAPPAAPGQAPAAQPGTYPTERAKGEAALQKYLAAAEAYPSSSAGIAARYHAASVLAQMGRTDEALKRYEETAERAAGSIYGQMARLGIAECEAAAGQYDKAIAKFTELVSAKDSKLPLEGILMQLGRVYQEKGSAADAKRTFKRVVDEFPQSPYAASAKRELDAIKG